MSEDTYESPRGTWASQDVSTARRRAWWNWACLVGTAVGATAGLTIAIVPLLLGRAPELWPWVHSEWVLLSGLFIVVALFTLVLTQRQSEINALQKRLWDLRDLELASTREQARAMRMRMEKQLAVDRGKTEELRRTNERLTGLFRLVRGFSSGFAHEFRTPLTVIKETVSSLREVPLDTEQQGHLVRVLHRVDDIDTLVDDLLDVTRIEAGLLCTFRKRCSIATIIESIRTKLQRRADGNRATLQFAIDPNLPDVYCDPENVARIVTNLLVNALKFCGEGGHVELCARLHDDARQVEVAVRDDGPGIANPDLTAIFEPFRQMREPDSSTQGLGVGLHIVRELVRFNLGDVRVDSAPDRGSDFTFTVPRAEPRILVEHYLSRLRHLETRENAVSLIVVRLASGGHASARAGFEQYLQANVRRTDLVLRVRPDTWLILAVTGATCARRLLHRLRTGTNTDAAPGSRLRAPFEWQIRGTWSITDQHEGLAEELDAAFTGGQQLALCTPDGLRQ